jgi:hypothetical protein
MNTIRSFAQLTDDELTAELKQCARSEREATARLIASLAEFDARRLYLAQGCSSLFTYCTQVLHLSEHAAYGRIEAARAARRFPALLGQLTNGSITLTTVGLLAPHLTAENAQHALEAARHKTKREVELLIATLRPRSDVPSSIRKLPSPVTVPVQSDQSSNQTLRATLLAVEAAHPPRSEPPAISPLAPERFRVQFTVSRETYDKLCRAQDLLCHSIPNGDTAIIFDRALSLLLAEAERTKFSATNRPRQKSRAHQRLTSYSRSCEARGVTARRRSMRIYWRRKQMHGTRISGVPPRDPVRGRGRDDD